MAKDEKKKNIILISIMILSVIGTLFLVFKKDKNDVNVANTLEDTLVDFQSGPTITNRVESDILSSSEFNELQEYGTLDFELEPRGKKNPFKGFDVLSDK